MDRRSFLKVIAASGVAVALPVGNTTVAQAAALLTRGAAPVGVMREIYAYDLARDLLILRYDICTGKYGSLADKNDIQLSVDMLVSQEEMRNADRMSYFREVAKETLSKELIKNGKTWNDLIPMQIPKGIMHGGNI